MTTKIDFDGIKQEIIEDHLKSTKTTNVYKLAIEIESLTQYLPKTEIEADRRLIKFVTTFNSCKPK